MSRLSASLKDAVDVSSVDVAVIGGGPAGSVLAWRLAHQEGLSVGLVDPDLDAPWPNNYGVWTDEWETLASELEPLELGECVEYQWSKTDCYFGGSWDVPTEERTRLDRGYSRVDRELLRKRLRDDDVVVKVNGFVKAAANSRCPNVYDTQNIRHDEEGTTLTLTSGEQLRARVVVDCTGFESKLTLRKDDPSPGFQIAYGFEAEVSGLGPYDSEAMVLFDYRTDHLDEPDQMTSREDAEKQPPTFMYVMPLGQGRAFFEETVLVSKPALSIAECERRCMKRLAHLGIEVVGPRTDVELCYIPMGGPIPVDGQRIVAFGAAAGIVHPATGYQLCRALKASGDVAKALGDALREEEVDGGGRIMRARGSPDKAAAAAYAALWGKQNKLQRDFALFGGDFLLTLDAQDLRGWFIAFFKLPQHVWSGFLAFWPGFQGNENHETRLGRLLFGLEMATKLPPQVALKLAVFIVDFSLLKGNPDLLRSVVPFLGDGDFFRSQAEDRTSSRSIVQGDQAVKNEIRDRLGLATPTADNDGAAISPQSRGKTMENADSSRKEEVTL